MWTGYLLAWDRLSDKVARQCMLEAIENNPQARKELEARRTKQSAERESPGNRKERNPGAFGMIISPRA
jgi:hypothetical protein